MANTFVIITEVYSQGGATWKTGSSDVIISLSPLHAAVQICQSFMLLYLIFFLFELQTGFFMFTLTENSFVTIKFLDSFKGLCCCHLKTSASTIKKIRTKRLSAFHHLGWRRPETFEDWILM